MRKSFSGAFAALKFALVDMFTPSLTTIASLFSKMERAIERSIDKQSRRLEQLALAENSIRQARIAADKELNSAYKLLNNVSGLTK
jgi:hypothetical protein